MNCNCTGQLIDCEGLAGGMALPGTACDDMDLNTTGDVYDMNCNCAGTPIGMGTNNLTLVITTDDNGSETSWEIAPAGSSTPVCSGNGYPDNQVSIENCNVADGCYELRVFDAMGDGMFTGTMGGYVLLDQFGNAIIDNEADGQFGAVSAISNNGAFCVPIGTDILRFADCGKLDLLPTDFIIAENNPAVVAQFGVGAQNDDGFQYWVYDPDGTFSRRIFLSHANPSLGAPPGPFAVNHLSLLSFNSVMAVPQNVRLNVRIRSRVNGVNAEFGPACVIAVDPAAAACPMTNLVDDPSDQFFACGVAKTFGGSDNVRAIPIAGANRYQFRFENVSEGYLRFIGFPSYTCLLRWTTLPLSDGVTYDVTVRASFDGGANYCPFGQSCQVTIVPAPTAFGRGVNDSVTADASMQLFPNPSNGEQVNIQINSTNAADEPATVRIADLSGKLVFDTQVNINKGEQIETISLDKALSKGTYLVTVMINDTTMNKLLIVQ